MAFLPTLAWCLYDLANTIFAINMTSYHFPVWIVSDQRMPEIAYSSAFSLSVLASATLMPWLGARSDRAGRKVPALAFWTVGCVAFTASLGWVASAPWALVLFAGANFCYQLAGVFYNALLPAVSSAGRMGRISGYGVAVGYVGTLIGISVTAPIVSAGGRQAAFLPTALLFLILALPSFFLVKEPVFNNWGQTPTVDNLAKRKSLAPFLVSAFFGLCAVSTIILFMSVYAKEAIGLSDASLHSLLVTSAVCAILGSLAWGWLSDRIGGYRCLWWAWGLWTIVLGLAAVSFHPGLFWLLGGLAGVALGGTWVASRVLLVEWVGAQRIGEAFGLFGLVSRLAAILGPMVWGLLLWVARDWGIYRYRLGMVILLSFMLVGWWLYNRAADASRRV